MQLGLIGLGKMGGNMAERLRLGGHQVVGFDFNADAVAKLTATGNVGVSTLEDLAKNLKGRRAIWIMVPQGDPVDQTIAKATRTTRIPCGATRKLRRRDSSLWTWGPRAACGV
jgi:6-phosphogluconate dehydrogenase